MSNDMNRPTTDRPTATYPTHPLATYTTQDLPEGWRVDPAGYLDLTQTDGGAAAARLAEADATPTQTFPVHPLGRQPQAFPAVEPGAGHEGAARAALWPEVAEQANAAFIARTGARVPARARARVYHTPARPEHEGGAPAAAPRRRERLALQRGRRERVRRHLRSALAAIALAAALLSVLQAYAASGITSARQTALAARNEGAVAAAPATAAPATAHAPQTEQATPTMSEQTPNVRTDI